MEKEFEALENLKTAPSFMGGTEKYRFSMNSVSVLLEDYELVKQALTELKAIKEAKPSEALELVDKMWQHLDLECLREIGNEGYNTIKQSLMKQLSGSQYTNIAIDEAVKPSEAMKCLENLITLTANYVVMIKELENTPENIQKFKEELCKMDTYTTIKQALLKAQELEKVLEILKPLCEVVETPIKKYRYLKINGVVVYTFKNQEEFELLKRWSEK